MTRSPENQHLFDVQDAWSCAYQAATLLTRLRALPATAFPEAIAKVEEVAAIYQFRVDDVTAKLAAEFNDLTPTILDTMIRADQREADAYRAAADLLRSLLPEGQA